MQQLLSEHADKQINQVIVMRLCNNLDVDQIERPVWHADVSPVKGLWSLEGVLSPLSR